MGCGFKQRRKPEASEILSRGPFVDCLGPHIHLKVLNISTFGPWLVLWVTEPLRCEICLAEVGHWTWTFELTLPSCSSLVL